MANALLKISENGLRLLTDWEKGPRDGSVPLSENGAALAPYVCPGGELTIGYGCTKWFDGEEVQIHHRLSGEAEALALLDVQLDEYEQHIRDLVTRPMEQHEFDAFTCLVYNIGRGNLEDAEALKAFNAGRLEDSAAAFGNWTGSTCDRPPKWLRIDPELAEAYKDKMAQDHKGGWRWVGRDGQYCRYMLRYDGLLNRHYSEALLVMGKDWTRALRSGGVKIDLTPTHPNDARWNAKKNRWEDNVADKTMFKDVLAFAWYDALPDSQIVPHAPEPVLAPTQPVAQEPAPAPLQTPAIAIVEDQSGISDLKPSQIVEQPAANPSAAEFAKVGAAPQGPSPTVAVPTPVPVPQDQVRVSPEAGVSSNAPPNPAEAASRPVPLPAPVAPPKPPVVIAPKTIDINAIPYGEIDSANGAKNMSESKRVIGMVVVGVGSVIQVVTTRLGVGTAIGAVTFDLSRDPVVVALFVGAVVGVVAFFTRKRGTKIVTKGMVEAKQVLK